MPEKIEGCLSLAGLTSIEGLILPKDIGDTVYLNNLVIILGFGLYAGGIFSHAHPILPAILRSVLIEGESSWYVPFSNRGDDRCGIMYSGPYYHYY